MALTYTSLGLIVAAIGLPFQIALQSPYVLVSLSVIFILLALSMFGVFTLQLPSSLQTKLTFTQPTAKERCFWGCFCDGNDCRSCCLSLYFRTIIRSIALCSSNRRSHNGCIYTLFIGLRHGHSSDVNYFVWQQNSTKVRCLMEKVKAAFGFVMLLLPIFPTFSCFT